MIHFSTLINSNPLIGVILSSPCRLAVFFFFFSMVFALKTTDRIRVNQHAGVARIFTSNNRYLKIGLNGSFVISGQKDIKYLVKILDVKNINLY